MTESLTAQLVGTLHAVSHDLGAPIRQIRTYGQIIERCSRDLDPTVGRHLDSMLRAASDVSQRLAALDRLVAALVQVPTPGTTDTAVAVADAWELTTATRRTEVPFPTDVSSIPIDASHNRLVAILRELFDNSMSVGAGLIKVTVTADSAGEVRIMVADDGPGFGAADPERAFRLLKRIHPGADVSGGVGLTLARRLAEDDGGAIVLENTEMGASATVVYPGVPGADLEARDG